MPTFVAEFNTASAAWICPADYGSNFVTGNDSDFESGIGSWTSANFTLTSDAAQAQSGTKCLKAVGTTTGASSILGGALTVVAGTYYGAIGYARAAVTARAYTIRLNWYSDAAATTLVANTQSAIYAETTTGWQISHVGAVAPATAIRCRISFNYFNNAVSEVHYVDTIFMSTTTGPTAAKIECWGSGGAGAAGQATRGGGGGGGGGYGRRNAAAVSPGQSYLVTVGPGGTAVNTSIITDGTISTTGAFGSNAATFNGGAAGTANVGDVTNNGGAGRTVPLATTTGGGGGGSAGDAGAGTTSTGTAGGAGGSAGGGTGGAGGSGVGVAGAQGNAPGAGGGGGASTAAVGAAGRPGRLKITWSTSDETVTTSDGITKNYQKQMDEGVTAADAITKNYQKPLNESVTAADAITKNYAKPLGENVSVADNFTKIVIWNRPVADSVAVTDNLNKAIQAPKNDVVNVTDAPVISYAKPQADSVTTGDTVTKVYRKYQDETVLVSDSIVKNYQKRMAENVATADAITKSYAMPLSENLSAIDAIAKFYAMPLPESVTVLDNVTITLVSLRYFMDSVLASDAMSMYLRTAHADLVTTLDAPSLRPILAKADTMVVIDNVQTVTSFNRPIADSVTTSDALAKVIGVKFEDSISGNAAPVPTGTIIFAILD